jgi:hypothetical protein
MLAPAGIEGNDGRDRFRVEKLVDPVGIEATIVHGGPDGDGQGVGRTGLEEAVETRRPHGAVRDMARFEQEMHRQGMLWSHYAVLKGAMAEKGGVPIGSVAPGRRHVRVEPLVIAPKNALGPTVTGRPAMWTGAGREGGTVAAEHEGLEIAEQTPLGRREDSTGEQQVFQARQQLLRPGLVCCSEQGLGQVLGDRIGLRGLAGLCGVAVGLFLLEVAPMAAFAQAAGADAMGVRRRIRTVFEAVDKGGEGADRRGLEGGKAGHLCQARLGT